METPIYIALSRQSELKRELNEIANNIANTSTDGFRGSRPIFQEYLEQTGSPGRRDRLSFTQDIGDYRDLREADLVYTQNSLDLAIRGNGYFVIGDPAQPYYTRSGKFHLDGQHRVVTADGYPVLQADGTAITLPDNQTDDVTIAGDGTVFSSDKISGVIEQPGNVVGKFNIVRFGDEQRLRQASATFYSSDQRPTPAPDVSLVQGALEKSNVEPIIELTRMLDIMSNYESVQKLLDAENQRIRATNTALVNGQSTQSSSSA